MKTKKMLALILSVVMALSILAGCGRNNNHSNAAVQVFTQLMEGKAKLHFTADTDLTKILQDAVQQSKGDIAAACNLVVQARNVKDPFAFSVSGASAARDGQHGVTLCQATGKTPEEAARNAFAQVKNVLEALPAGGTYKAFVSMIKNGSDYSLALDLEVVKAAAATPGDSTKKTQEPEPSKPDLSKYGTMNKNTLTIGRDASLDELAEVIRAARNMNQHADTVDFTSYQGTIPAGILDGTGVKKIVVNDDSQIQPGAFANIGLAGKALTIEVKGTNQITQSILGGANQVCLVLADATQVKSGAFQKWTQLTGVSLPKAGEIGVSAFWGCTNLVNVYLGPMAAVNPGAFSGCNHLRAVYYGSQSMPSWNRGIGWQPTSIKIFSNWNRAESQKDQRYLVYGVPSSLGLADAWPSGFFQ